MTIFLAASPYGGHIKDSGQVPDVALTVYVNLGINFTPADLAIEKSVFMLLIKVSINGVSLKSSNIK